MRNLHRWRSAVVVLALVLSFGPYTSALADCPVESFLEEPFLAQNEGGADGIGGSGMLPGGDEEDGIGGSGIYGTVTGFGSICLNGRRLIYDEDVAITTDGVSSAIDELAVGHVVLVDFEASADALRAKSIQIQHELVGPVTAYHEDSLEVMGEKISIQTFSSEEMGSVEIGTRVAVSGLRGAGGRLIASRLDLAAAILPDLVRGELTVDKDGRAMIGAIHLDTSDIDTDIETDTDTSADREVESRPVPDLSSIEWRGRQWLLGHWNDVNSRFEVTRAAMSPRALKTNRRVDVEGYITRASESEIQIGDLRFRIEGRVNGSVLEMGDRVRVRGVLSHDRSAFQATSVLRLPGPDFLRSLDRSLRAPRLTPQRIDDRRRPEVRDESPHLPLRHRIHRHRIDRIRPDRPHLPRPRQDVIDGRRSVDRD